MNYMFIIYLLCIVLFYQINPILLFLLRSLFYHFFARYSIKIVFIVSTLFFIYLAFIRLFLMLCNLNWKNLQFLILCVIIKELANIHWQNKNKGRSYKMIKKALFTISTSQFEALKSCIPFSEIKVFGNKAYVLVEDSPYTPGSPIEHASSMFNQHPTLG